MYRNKNPTENCLVIILYLKCDNLKMSKALLALINNYCMTELVVIGLDDEDMGKQNK